MYHKTVIFNKTKGKRQVTVIAETAKRGGEVHYLVDTYDGVKKVDTVSFRSKVASLHYAEMELYGGNHKT